MSWNAWDVSTALFPVLRLVCNWTKQRRPWKKIPIEKPWKSHFRESNFQNVPRCPGDLGEIILALFWFFPSLTRYLCLGHDFETFQDIRG